MNHDPAEIVFIDHIIGPNDGCDRFLSAAEAVDLILPHVGIQSFGTIVRVMQSDNGQSDGHGQAHATIGHRFLQNNKPAFMLFFIRNNATERDLAPEGVQRILRFEDRGFQSQYFELFQILTTAIAHPNERR